MALHRGDLVDSKYRIERSVGRGGMATVYRAVNEAVHRRVAIKVLHRNRASPEALERFQREAQATGRIGSPHIVEVFDLGHLGDGSPYMVMEYLQGETLADRQKRVGRLLPEEVTPLLREALDGLAAAHAAGIVHRDLKPGNLFIVKVAHGEYVKLIDFGVSKFSMMKAVTRTSVMLGTPMYMAPEQTKGGRTVDHRTDIFAAGVTLYRVVSGRSPYAAKDFNAIVMAISRGEVIPLEENFPGLDPAFAAIVMRAMAFDPAHRYQSAQELSQALADWEDHGGYESQVEKTVTDVILSPVRAARGVNRVTASSLPTLVLPAVEAAPEEVPPSRTAPLPLVEPPRAPRATSRAPASGISPARAALLGAFAGVLLGAIVVLVAYFLMRSPSSASPPPTTTALP